MATHANVANYDKDLEKIEQAMEELKARAKQLRSRVGQRQRLLKYCSENSFSRADMMWCVHQLPLTRISQKHRKARLAEVRQKHAPNRKKKPSELKNKPRPEHRDAANQLHEARTAKGWTMSETARQVGVHNSMISSWEGAKWGITAENRKKLEDVLDFKFKD
jgi:hypothetical protein